MLRWHFDARPFTFSPPPNTIPTPGGATGNIGRLGSAPLNITIILAPSAALTTGTIDYLIESGTDPLTFNTIDSGTTPIPGPTPTTITLGPYTAGPLYAVTILNHLSNPLTTISITGA